jgi:hypothetical protein
VRQKIKLVGSLSIIALLTGSLVLGTNIPWAHAVVSTSYQLVSQRPMGSTYVASAGFRGSHNTSSDGRYVLFASSASDLVSGDTNGLEDLFLRDTVSNTTTRVNVSSTGSEANAYSTESASMSYDGRYVVFSSKASNLDTGIVGTSIQHIYLRDTVAGTTTLVDRSSSGAIGTHRADFPSVSADGRYVVFSAAGTSLVPGMGTTSHAQIYIKDMHRNALKVLSVTPAGVQANSNSAAPDISCDGNVVAFMSAATNLGVPSGQPGRADLIVVHLGWDGVVLTNTTSSSDYGVNGNPSMDPQVSCDGNKVLFTSSSSNIVSPAITSPYQNIYQYDRLSNGMRQVSLGNGNVQPDSWQQYKNINASMSGDGRYVAFASYARNMDTTYPKGTDTGSDISIYIRDMKNSTTETVTKLPSGNRSAWAGMSVGMSSDGTVVTFGHKTPGIYYPTRALNSSFSTGTTSDVLDIYKTDTGH